MHFIHATCAPQTELLVNYVEQFGFSSVFFRNQGKRVLFLMFKGILKLMMLELFFSVSRSADL